MRLLVLNDWTKIRCHVNDTLSPTRFPYPLTALLIRNYSLCKLYYLLTYLWYVMILSAYQVLSHIISFEPHSHIAKQQVSVSPSTDEERISKWLVTHWVYMTHWWNIPLFHSSLYNVYISIITTQFLNHICFLPLPSHSLTLNCFLLVLSSEIKKKCSR